MHHDLEYIIAYAKHLEADLMCYLHLDATLLADLDSV